MTTASFPLPFPNPRIFHPKAMILSYLFSLSLFKTMSKRSLQKIFWFINFLKLQYYYVIVIFPRNVLAGVSVFKLFQEVNKRKTWVCVGTTCLKWNNSKVIHWQSNISIVSLKQNLFRCICLIIFSNVKFVDYKVFLTNAANVFLLEPCAEVPTLLKEQVDACKAVLIIFRRMIMELTMNKKTW